MKPDKNKVIKGLEHCTVGKCCEGCPYFLGNARCRMRQLLWDSLSLISDFIEKDNEIEELKKEIKKRTLIITKKNKAVTL